MKTIILLVGVWLASNYHLMAQDVEIVRVKAGEDPAKAIPFTERYRYGEFRQGELVFMNSSSSMAKFNYNILLGEMQFIDQKGDTLSLTDDYAIQLVAIGPDRFYYEHPKTYVELVADYPSVKLAAKRALTILESEKKGGYGQSTGISSIKNYGSYSNNNGSLQKLDSKADMLFSKKIAFFLIDQNKRFWKANRASILEVFAKHSKQIKQYRKVEAVNFDQEADLKKLLQFCSDLT